MKKTRHIVAALLAAGMMLALVGCGNKEKTVTLRADLSEKLGVDLPVTDTMTLTAKGDTIQQQKEVIEFDFSDTDERTKDAYIAFYDNAFASMTQDIDGITFSSKTYGSIYSIEITIDYTDSNTIQAASDAGLFEIENEFINKFSLKATQEDLIASGYTVVE